MLLRLAGVINIHTFLIRYVVVSMD